MPVSPETEIALAYAAGRTAAAAMQAINTNPFDGSTTLSAQQRTAWAQGWRDMVKDQNQLILQGGLAFFPIIYTEYLVAGTYLHQWNPYTRFVSVVGIGPGGGGASGRKDVAGNRSGGGGGGGGGAIQWLLPISAFVSPCPIVVGAGGAGGLAQSVDSTNGNNGTAGDITMSMSLVGGRRLGANAMAGSPGTGGGAASGAGGNGSTGMLSPGSNGGSGRAAPSVGDSGQSLGIGDERRVGASGGGGGGGGSAGAFSAGGDGGASQQGSIGLGSLPSPGLGALTDGAAGGDGVLAMPAGVAYGGLGGGGGAGSLAGSGGRGGNGVRGSGGGGGGNGTNGAFSSGAGGRGGDGCWLITELS